MNLRPLRGYHLLLQEKNLFLYLHPQLQLHLIFSKMIPFLKINDCGAAFIFGLTEINNQLKSGKNEELIAQNRAMKDELGKFDIFPDNAGKWEAIVIQKIFSLFGKSFSNI